MEVIHVGTVAEFETRKDLTLVMTDLDVQAIKTYLGNRNVNGFGCFLVKIENGDYTEIYGINGSVPYLDKSVYKILLQFGDLLR